MLAGVYAAFCPWNVKSMMDSIYPPTSERKYREIDREEALQLALQWRFKTASLFLGFAAIIIVCTTIIIVNQQAGTTGVATEKNQEQKSVPLINQTFNSVLTTNTAWLCGINLLLAAGALLFLWRRAAHRRQVLDENSIGGIKVYDLAEAIIECVMYDLACEDPYFEKMMQAATPQQRQELADSWKASIFAVISVQKQLSSIAPKSSRRALSRTPASLEMFRKRHANTLESIWLAQQTGQPAK
jgi:hypothetical protein